MEILILGMHRSGTSMTARLLNMMGAWLGPPAALLPANPDNPKGFWERKDVIRANAGLLRHAHATWRNVARYEAAQLASAPREPVRAVVSKLNKHAHWAIKDPRLCLTLPCWLPELSSPVAVIVSRHRRKVAESLHRRNGMPLQYGLALWEFYAVQVIRHTQDLPKIFVRYEDLVSSPMRVARNLKQALPELKLPQRRKVLDFIDTAPRRKASPPIPHRKKLLSMLRGKTPFTEVEVSPQALRRLRKFGPKAGGASAKK